MYMYRSECLFSCCIYMCVTCLFVLVYILFLKSQLCHHLESVLLCNSSQFWCSGPFTELIDPFCSFCECELPVALCSPLCFRATYSWKAFALPRALCTHLPNLPTYSQWVYKKLAPSLQGEVTSGEIDAPESGWVKCPRKPHSSFSPSLLLVSFPRPLFMRARP